jgi:hypothetical protein
MKEEINEAVCLDKSLRNEEVFVKKKPVTENKSK